MSLPFLKRKTVLSCLMPEFDPSFYRANNRDLANHDELALKEHYDLHGRHEGRRASRSAARDGFNAALQYADKALEIGPFNKPVLSGSNAKFFDVLSQEALRQRAVNIGVSPAGVPKIDYVSPTADLGIVDEEFDLVVSSHSIEHQVDLVRHLKQVERLLVPDGVYAMWIPNCRYCFDHYLPPSELPDVLDAYYEERKVHRLAKVIEHRAFTTHNDPRRHWDGDHGAQSRGTSSIRAAISEWKSADGGYIDVHAWQFTPSSFRNLIGELNQLGLTELRIHRVYETLRNSNEFAAVLIR